MEQYLHTTFRPLSKLFPLTTSLSSHLFTNFIMFYGPDQGPPSLRNLFTSPTKLEVIIHSYNPKLIPVFQHLAPVTVRMRAGSVSIFMEPYPALFAWQVAALYKYLMNKRIVA